MDSDLSSVTFNRNHKTDSAALEAISGIRLVLAALVVNIALTVLSLGRSPEADFLPEVLVALPGWVMVAAWLAGYGCGAYGTYSIMSAIGWSGAIGFLFFTALVLPYVNLVVLIVVLVKASELIGASQYRFSLFGKVEKRAGAES